MRRNDREVTDFAGKLAILASCEVVRLAFCDGDTPYIVPMSFGFAAENERLTLYFHCAHKGKKLDILQRNPRVCFEADCNTQLRRGETGCQYGMVYQSVVGNGEICIVADEAEKIRALQLLMRQYAPDKAFDFTAEQARAVTVLRLAVDGWSGKICR